MNGGRKVYLRRYSKSILLLFCIFRKKLSTKKKYNFDLLWKKKVVFTFGVFSFPLSPLFFKNYETWRKPSLKKLSEPKKVNMPFEKPWNYDLFKELIFSSPCQLFLVKTWRLSMVIWKVFEKKTYYVYEFRCGTMFFFLMLRFEVNFLMSYRKWDVKIWKSS